MSVQDTAIQAANAMIQAGYTPHTAWNEYASIFAPIVRLHQKHKKEEFDAELVAEYIHSAEMRFFQGEIVYRTFRRLTSGAERMLSFVNGTGVRRPHHGAYFRLEGYHGGILEDFIENGNGFGASSKKNAVCDFRQHLEWLCKNEIHNLSEVTGETIQKYLQFCAGKYQPQTLLQILRRLKRIYGFLKRTGYIDDDFSKLFEFKISLPKSIHPAIPVENIIAILEQIDRDTPKGKRDYAIILLGVVTGLRACDVAKLRLTDINWRDGEIQILQQKTRTPLTLPLTGDVAVALKDYILNGRIYPVRVRQHVNHEIFLSINVPCSSMSAASVSRLYSYYRLKAGLQAGGFHDLRRAAGKNMVVAEVPVTTVAQVLGIVDLDTTKQYISLDSVHLKECALGFKGIEPKAGELE